jgi:hypothetical protein
VCGVYISIASSILDGSVWPPQEFLDEMLKEAFNPELNLFTATADNRLYPSPSSYIHSEVC